MTASQALVIASEDELPVERHVWGTGGWVPADQREALDWLTLLRLLGWDVSVARLSGRRLSRAVPNETRWVIIASDPDTVDEETASMLARFLNSEPAMVVVRASAPESPLARLAGASRLAAETTGATLTWTGHGAAKRWLTGRPLSANALILTHDVTTWASMEGSPLIAARRLGFGTVVTLAAHPGEMRDAGGGGTALMRHLLTAGPAAPVAWLDFDNTLVLRMDDPGGAQNVHSRAWGYTKINETGWGAITADLRRRDGRLSVLYTAGWVDDGDASRGALSVAGAAASRVAGRIHPSPHVVYQEAAGDSPAKSNDYASEFRGIKALRDGGAGDIELHGYTHMHPDAAAWARSADRYEALAWFRELGRAAAPTIAGRPRSEHPISLGIKAIERHFGVMPTTLVPPGDEWTDDALETALEHDLQLVDSYYLALRHDGRFCWATHVCAPYLDRPDAAWFESGLPVIGYFHDRELALEGVEWMSGWLDRWQGAGARRLIDFRELAGALGHRVYLEEIEGLRLHVENADGPPLVRRLPIAFRPGNGSLPAELTVTTGESELSLPVREIEAGVGRVNVPLEPRAGTRYR
ncbi:MAG: hypothetical protein H0T48_07965 [Gemmatimonadaceae bacterium]|nr:hypothetical protein [Gemmatimonadaceae bacterium]